MKNKKNRKPRQSRAQRREANAPYKSTYERHVAEWMQANKVPFSYEGVTLPYPQPSPGKCLECGGSKVARLRKYVPDFWVNPEGAIGKPEDTFVLETKGRFTSEDRTKMLSVIEEYPMVRVRMLFMRDNPLNKKSKIRYTDWCKKHGIECAVGVELPAAWIVRRGKRK